MRCGAGCARSEIGLMMHNRIPALCAALACVLLMGQAPPGGAGLGMGLNVSPAKLELSMKPGETYNLPVTIQNGSGASTHVQASMVDFGVLPNGQYQFDKVGRRPYSLLRWASINPREFDIASNSTQQVRVSLNVPQAPLSGEYAGIVFFQTRPERQQHAVAFSVRVASKIYLTITGTTKIDGAVAKMSAAPTSSGENYRVLFRNTGNTHVYINGELRVLKDGVTVDRIALPSSQLVERGGDRLIELSGKSLQPGKYQAIATVDYGGKTQTAGEIVFDKHQ